MDAKSKPAILLIDDEKDILLTIGDFLNLNGYSVLTATNGEEALRQLEKNKPDLIILDINMPKMNGLAFLTAVQARPEWADIPVYVFTGRANMEQYFAEVRVAGFMAKPCLPDKLIKDIKNILTQRTQPKAEFPKGARFKLLLVEPNASRHQELAEQFSRAGIEVVTPLGVGDAVQTALAERPNGMMIRMFMEGMDAAQIVSILRMIPATRNLPILIYDDAAESRSHSAAQDQGNHLQSIVTNARNKDLLGLMQRLMQGS